MKNRIIHLPCHMQDCENFQFLPTGFGAGTPQQVPGAGKLKWHFCNTGRNLLSARSHGCKNGKNEFLGLKAKLAL
jgi:hypothetical protein